MKVKKQDAYTVFAQYYDMIMDEVPYDEWVQYVVSLLREIGFTPETMLDLACGTGNMALRLARLGYAVRGIDGSEAMVDIARKKVLAEEIPVIFEQGDFRSFQLVQPVDLVLCVYDSLNYLLTEEDLVLTFQRVAEAVRIDGYFIFDMNTIRRLTTIEEGNSMVEGDNYYFFWKDQLDPAGPFWHVHLTIFENLPDGSMYREDEVHTERGYPIEKIRELVQGAGFVVERLYDAYTQNPASEESMRVFVVARRKV